MGTASAADSPPVGILLCFFLRLSLLHLDLLLPDAGLRGKKRCRPVVVLAARCWCARPVRGAGCTSERCYGP